MKTIKKVRSIFLICLLLSLAVVTGCKEAENVISGSTLPRQTDAKEQSTEASATDARVTEASDVESQNTGTQNTEVQDAEVQDELLPEDGSYFTKEEVALYLYTYDHLPDNFVTKQEAEEMGWESRKGNLWEVAPGVCIGGNRFGNYEGLLPTEDGRIYYECDVEYDGGYRGDERIIYSNDGLIYYTDDHYESFELLYGEE